jgi:general nucleoside transport system permease protein
VSSSTLVASRVGISAKTAAWIGMALGVVAAYVALPPLTLRTALPSLLLAAAGIAAGVYAGRGGERRLGAIAIGVALLGGIIAVVAVKSGEGNLDRVFVWSALIAGMLRFATPLIFGAMGGILSERSGVINIGLEGMMLMGAFFGIFGADIVGSWLGGILIGVAAGAATRW